MSETTDMLGISLGVLGFFAAIYHPVGIAMLIKRPGKVGLRIGVNGVWGNMGVAVAPILTGLLIAYSDWRLAFIVPAILCLTFGISQIFAFKESDDPVLVKKSSNDRNNTETIMSSNWQTVLICLSIVTLSGGFIFGSLTFLIPRLFEVNMLQISMMLPLLVC